MELVSQPHSLIDWLSQPWHWAFSGAVISLVMFLMTWMGRSFGVSSTFKVFCNIAGAGKRYSFFNFELRDEYWRLTFIAGAVVGGYLASTFLANPQAVDLAQPTIEHLANWDITYPQGNGFLPTEQFNLTNPKGILLSVIGGFLIGFGARYGRGCTSGHAITGLSHMQLPSLITVIGFFIGGLLMTWGIMPFIFG